MSPNVALLDHTFENQRMIHVHINTKVSSWALVAAFSAGCIASPLALRALSAAESAAPALTPMTMDLAAMKAADLGNTPYPELKSKTLVTTDNATVAIQSGNVGKHTHPKTDEIQYIIEGSGTIWLGTQRVEFKPGTLLVIPKGTAHAGSVVTKGPVKAIAIKIPPQPAGDIVFED
jgi:mannose-6-phosphate isomerase-like protein (cupin superfamily)